MADSFKAVIKPVNEYVRRSEDDCFLLELSFTIIQDAEVHEIKESSGFGYECSDKDVEAFLKLCEDYLQNKLERDARFVFSLPFKTEKYIYPFCFDVTIGESAAKTHFSFIKLDGYGDSEITYELSYEQVQMMCHTLRTAIAKIDWDTYGKVDQYEFEFPDRPYTCCYSASGLETKLKDLLDNQRILGIYVDAGDYLHPFHANLNFLDLWGGRALFEFDQCFVDFDIQSYSNVQYRFFTRDEVIVRHDYGYLKESTMCSIVRFFSPDYTGEFVKRVSVEPTAFYGYWHKNFEAEELRRASMSKDLPSTISIDLSNSTTFSIGGWDADFFIKLNHTEA